MKLPLDCREEGSSHSVPSTLSHPASNPEPETRAKMGLGLRVSGFALRLREWLLPVGQADLDTVVAAGEAFGFRLTGF